mgnify:CR=1 FL=1
MVLEPLQNPQFWSKIKIAKQRAKNISTTHCSCFMQKTAPKNSSVNIRKIRAFLKLPKMAIQPLQNPHFGSKIKNA